MLDVADTVISEPVGGAHNNPVQMAENLQEYLIGAVKKLSQVPMKSCWQIAIISSEKSAT